MAYEVRDYDSDEGSIQGSPLLDTEPTFNARPSASSYNLTVPPLMTPGSIRPRNQAVGPGSSIPEPYPASVSSSKPKLPPMARHISPSLHKWSSENSTGGPPSGPLEGSPTGLSITVPNLRRRSTDQLNTQFYRDEHPPTGPLSGPPSAPLSGPVTVLNSPGNDNEPTLTRDLASKARVSTIKMADANSGLQFSSSRSKPRPYSMLLRSNFDDAVSIGGNRRSMPPLAETSGNDDLGIRDEEEEEPEDALPFEATKEQATRDRPQSSVALPSLATGIVMSKDKFESYRKSLSSLDLLRQDSVLDERHSANSANIAGTDENEEDDDEERTEKERKKQQAKYRQEQEARMSVYRQRMSKIGPPEAVSVARTTEPNSGVPVETRSTLLGESITTNNVSDEDEDDIMDDIPLTILRAHGFPRGQKTATGAGKLSPSTLSPGFTGSSSPGPQQMTYAANGDSPGLGVRTSASMSNLQASSVSPRPASVASTSALTSGHGTRNRQSMLPPIFGNNEAPVSRGLVAEIAREENAKAKRMSMPFGAYGQATVEAPDPKTKGQNQIDEIQKKLQVLLDSQVQIMSHLGANGQLPYIASPSLAEGGHQPSLDHIRVVAHQRAPSVAASYQSHDYLAHYPETVQSLQAGQPTHSTSPPSMRSVRLPSAQPMYATRTVQNRPSMMRMVPGHSHDDDEDDDGDEAWDELLNKRQLIRAKWEAAL